MRTLKPALYFAAGIITSTIIVCMYSFREENKKQHYTVNDSLDFKWRVPKVPLQFSFAGEKVPLDRAEIREQFDHDLTMIYYQTGTMLNLLKLTRRWFPVIEERLKVNGVPDDFKYVCVAESNLQNLISRVGAVGFWQFMSYTTPGYDVQVNDNVDERYNVLKSTDAACNFFKQGYNMLGSWTAAAASYDCGRGKYHEEGVFQQTMNYYDLHLPEETNRYMYRVLAFKYVIENSSELGFQLSDEDYRQPYKTIAVNISSSITNLAQYAISNGTTYKMLKTLNPWLRKFWLFRIFFESVVLRLF